MRGSSATGSRWGINLSYAIQPTPGGLAQAFIIGADFIGDSPSTLILGDNIFFGHNLSDLLGSAGELSQGATVFTYCVDNPGRYGVAELGPDGSVVSLEEKPDHPKSNFAITGLYYYDAQAVYIARSLLPSARGELEITDLNRKYLQMNQLKTKFMGRGYAWFDAGTHDSLLDAGQFIATIEKRQGQKVACPEEIAWRKGWISNDALIALAQPVADSGYGRYLMQLVSETHV